MTTTLRQSPTGLTDAQWTDKWGAPLTGEPQAFVQLPDQAYRELPGWNASLLKIVVDRGEYHAWREYLDPSRPPREEKPHFISGSIFHCRLNEPDELDKRFVVLPSDLPSRPTAKQLQKPPPKKDGTWNEGTQAYQNWLAYCQAEECWQKFLKEHQGKQFVTQSLMAEGVSQALAVLNHPVLGGLYSDHPWKLIADELTLTYIDPITRSRCKARIDALRIIEGILYALDTKGAQDASPRSFGKDAGKFGYIIQAAFYLDAVFHCGRAIEKALGLSDGALIGLPSLFRFIVVEKDRPCSKLVATYDTPEEHISLGRRAYRKALNQIDAAHRMRYYEGYSESAVELQLPPFELQKVLAFIGDAEQ